MTETVRLMGAAATPMAFGEIYTGLQAGVIDGLEHDAPTILAASSTRRPRLHPDPAHLQPVRRLHQRPHACKRLPAAQRDGLLKAVRRPPTSSSTARPQVETNAIKELQKQGRDGRRMRPRRCSATGCSPMWDRFAGRTPGAKSLLDAMQQTAKA